jgi:hypothetical protein
MKNNWKNEENQGKTYLFHSSKLGFPMGKDTKISFLAVES